MLHLHSALQLERLLLLNCAGDPGEVRRVALVDVCVGCHQSLAVLPLRAVVQSRAVDPDHYGCGGAALDATYVVVLLLLRRASLLLCASLLLGQAAAT